jgi:hypothetical protein
MLQSWSEHEENHAQVIKYFECEARERTLLAGGSIIEEPTARGRGVAFIIGLYRRRWYIGAAVALLHIATIAIIWRSMCGV